jgi:Fic family protein
MGFLPPYIHALPEWPTFQWSPERLLKPLQDAKIEQARLLGRVESLGFQLQQDAIWKTLTVEVIKTSEIEGEFLNPEQVRSSVARRLGIEEAGLAYADKHVDGVVEMVMDATGNYRQPLTADRLFGYHNVLFPTGRSGMRKITVAAYRSLPIEVVSGREGNQRVHFEGPDAEKVEPEMVRFLHWFNDPARDSEDWMVTSAVAHLWFITIHPFDDGNGRIARAISDMCLARAERSAQRFYSLSSQIRHDNAAYYRILEATQKDTLDISKWMEWFIACIHRAILRSQTTLAGVFAKAQFWNTYANAQLNQRQRTMLNKLLDGFEGHLTTEKWMKITKAAQRTAVRDIQDLVELGALVKNPGGGRSTSYRLADLKIV